VPTTEVVWLILRQDLSGDVREELADAGSAVLLYDPGRLMILGGGWIGSLGSLSKGLVDGRVGGVHGFLFCSVLFLF
jgi:hypothetical protein